MTLEGFNKSPIDEARDGLTKCCGSSSWVDQMVKRRPFASEDELMGASTEIWFACNRTDWLEAFSHHPKIGDKSSLENKFATTKDWAGEEQSRVASANIGTLERLIQLNEKYEKKFGYIFIVYATGKSAEEMAEIVELRMKNNPYDEIKIAASEQNRITRLRLKKLIS